HRMYSFDSFTAGATMIDTLLQPSSGVRVRRVDVVTSGNRRASSRSQRPRTVVLTFAILFVMANVAVRFMMDSTHPEWRDPEYGRRLKLLKQHQSQNANRDLVLILGSSRTAMGVRPEYQSATGPLVFNFAQVGSGPMMTVMTLRRLLAEGIRPKAIVCEFWPAFLRGDGPYSEESRIDLHRLLTADRPFIDDYFLTHEHTRAIMREIRWWPLYEHRIRWMSILQPGWLRHDRRLDGSWFKLDRFGWLPGMDEDPSPTDRAIRHDHGQQYFQPLFRNYEISAVSRRAMTELIGTCQEHGIALQFVWLPESSEFQAKTAASVSAAAEQYLCELCAAHALHWIDARDWVDDSHMIDGFHPNQPGAAQLSRRLFQEATILQAGPR
ncbi:MAG: hypothetical protein ACRCZF_04095, partial [Gemmataceae bacterium]